MPDAAKSGSRGLPGAQRGPAQPLPDVPGAKRTPNHVPPPDLSDDTDGDVAPKDRQKMPQSSEEAFGEPADD